MSIYVFYCVLFESKKYVAVYVHRWDTKLHSWQVTAVLKPMIVNLDFQRGGKTVFKTVNFAGYIGALTGIKPVRTLSICPAVIFVPLTQRVQTTMF